MSQWETKPPSHPSERTKSALRMLFSCAFLLFQGKTDLSKLICLKYLVNEKHTAEVPFACMAILNTCDFLQYCLHQNPGWRILFLSPRRTDTVWIKLHQLHGSVRMPFPIKSVNAFCFGGVDVLGQKCSTYVCVACDSFMHEWLWTYTVPPITYAPSAQLSRGEAASGLSRHAWLCDNLWGGGLSAWEDILWMLLCALGETCCLWYHGFKFCTLFSYRASSVTSVFGKDWWWGLCGTLGIKCVNCALIRWQRGKHQVKNVWSWHAGSLVQWDRASKQMKYDEFWPFTLSTLFDSQNQI